jgi:hypothetical protein
VNLTVTDVSVLLWLVFGLGVLVLSFIVSAVMEAIEEWSERRKDVTPAAADQEMQTLRSMGTIQDAYLQAHQAMHDAAGPQP